MAEGESRLAKEDLVGAREAFEAAVALAEKEHGGDMPELILPLWWLAKAWSAHKYEPCPEVDIAIKVEGRAVAIAERAWAEDHTRLMSLLDSYSTSLWVGGRHDDAVAVLARVKDFVSRSSRDTSAPLSTLVVILLDAGKPVEALAYARELVQVEDEVHGAPTRHALFLLGDCLRKAGTRDEARAQLLRFLSMPPDAGDQELNATVRQWLDELGPD